MADKYPLKDKLEGFQEDQCRTKTQKRKGGNISSKWPITCWLPWLMGEQGGGRRESFLISTSKKPLQT